MARRARAELEARVLAGTRKIAIGDTSLAVLQVDHLWPLSLRSTRSLHPQLGGATVYVGRIPRALRGGLHSNIHSCKTGSLGLLHMI